MTEQTELPENARRKGDAVIHNVNATAVLQALTIAIIIWFGSRVVSMSEIIAVHEWRLSQMETRLNLEGANRGNYRISEGKIDPGPGGSVGIPGQ